MTRQELFWILIIKISVTGFFATALWLNWGRK
jgi:hypothetical protein